MKAFSNLLLEENEKIMKLIDSTPIMDLAIALKFAECDLQEHFFSNMPAHKKQTLCELMSELEDISQDEANLVQAKILENF
jgi:flagellar motor switch protein FliG